jgi:hypothetical protein
MNREFARGRMPQGVFIYAIDIVAIDDAVDRKVGILARWRNGRRATAAGNPDSGVADAARMVPGSLCRCCRSAPDLHGASRTGREECQFSEHSEGRECFGHHALGTSCRTRKGQFRENREPQGSRCSRKEPGARRSGDAGTKCACAQGVTRGDLSFVETQSSRTKTSSRNQKQGFPLTQITNQTSHLIYAAGAFAAGCLFGNPELDLVEAGRDGRLTVKKWCLSARFRTASTSTLAHTRDRDFSAQPDVWPDYVPVYGSPAPRQCGPITRLRRHQT